MSGTNDVLKAVKNAVVLNERVTRLAKQVECLADAVAEQDKRLIRVEAFIDLVRPAVTRRLSGP